MNLFSRTDDSLFGRWWWTVDRGILAAFLGLAALGVIMVAAASPPVAERIGVDPYRFVVRHLTILGPALAIMIAVSLMDIRTLWRTATVVLGVGALALVYVLFAGMEIKGAQRWIALPGFSLQPSEFVKPAFIVVAAWLITRHKEDADFPANLICAGLYLMIAALLLLQPDFGMTLVVTLVLAAQIFIAGMPFRYLIVVGLGGMLLVVCAYFSFAHVQSRIDRFLDPSAGDNYQIEQALDAFRHGGAMGTGPGQGAVKLRIPDAHADFVFAVAGEELGLWGLLLLLGVYAYVVLRGFRLLMNSGDMFAVLAAGGLLVMFGMQALVHMGSNTHLLPTKGMTLPFVSYGGSSLLSTAFAAGMILGLTRRQARSAIARGGLSGLSPRKAGV